MSESKMGAPTKYRQSMCETIIEIMKEGGSLAEVAAEIDISEETINQWRKEGGDYFVADFSEAIKIGIRKSKAWWEKHGRKNLDNKEFNSTLWYMNMKNRFKWSDRQEIEQKVEVNDTSLTDDERAIKLTAIFDAARARANRQSDNDDANVVAP